MSDISWNSACIAFLYTKREEEINKVCINIKDETCI